MGENETSDGTTRILGTVTITGTNSGSYLGGGFMFPLGDFICGNNGGGSSDCITAPLAGGAFTVIPEPSTGLFLALGLAGIGVARRRK